MATATAQERYPLTQGVNPWLVTVSVMLPTFMEVLDTAIASVALPYIAGSLSATTSEATWVLTSYLVANAVILPASNWFGRRFGRKRFLLTCVVIFTIASFFCGAAPSLGVILLARVVQGAGGGALQPISQSILLESFPPAKRSAAMAAYALGIVVAPVIGPTLGGWLTDTFSWRYAFYINLPVGILAVLYVIVPWVAVMSAGFAFGAIVRRRDLCIAIGLGAIALFLILRGIDAYGDPRHWHSMPAQTPLVIRFLNTTKYPASLDYLLMTLGPTILALPFLRGPKFLDTFGRVPLFFYALHIPLIHAMACVVSLIRSGSIDPWLFTNHPMMNPPPPDGYTWSLGLLYLVWIIAIVLLWPVCQWYARRKATRRSPWMSYI